MIEMRRTVAALWRNRLARRVALAVAGALVADALAAQTNSPLGTALQDALGAAWPLLQAALAVS